MSTCDRITSSLSHNCDDKLAIGLKDILYLINIDDIDKDSCTFDASNSLLLTQIALNTASPALAAYSIEGFNFSNEHDTALVKRRFIDGWDHNLRFRVFDNTPEIKLWIKNAVGSRFVAIIKNTYNNKNATTPGTTVYEVLGWEYGLEISEATRNPNDEESAGAWILYAQCDETNKEPDPPLTLFVGGTLAATEAAIAALL